MPTQTDVGLEIAHVLFIDIVGYSKLLTNEQRERLSELSRIVRETEAYRTAEAAGKLIKLPTGDGMVLAFFTTPDAPARCAIAISRAVKANDAIPVRMGIHSGPVEQMSHVDDRPNLAGAGVNMAQRVMDCGDGGHILLSKRVADDLAQYSEWKPHLHELGEVEAKHGLKVPIVNFFADDIGNPALPEKIRRAEEERAQAAASVRRQKRKRIVVLASAALVLLLGVGVGSWVWQRRSALVSAYKTGAAGIVEKSIAVLPFENVGDDQQNDYLADGVQDDILTDLTKVADLKVISRRSVAQYRDSKDSIRQIGQALQVAHVLQGTVRKVADRIHVTAQLVDTRSEAQTWAEKYDSDIADIIQIQNDISQAIVTQLKAALSPAEKAALEAKPTNDREAYDLYLRARALVYAQQTGMVAKTEEENTAKAIMLLKSAIARDPKFALAYSVLAEAQLSLEQFDEAKKALDTALAISPGLVDAHLVRARYYQELKDPAAEKELAIAAAGLPGRAEVFELRADVETQRGQWKQAVRDLEKARELDPQNLDTSDALIFLQIVLRDYNEAERLLDQTMPLAPQQSIATFWRYKCYIALARGDAKAAMAALDSSPARNAGLHDFNHLVAYVFVLQRNYQAAEDVLRSAQETAKKQNVLTIKQERTELYRRAMALEKLGKIARYRGEAEKARSYFETARPLLKEWLDKNSGATSYDTWVGTHAAAYIAEIDAALGRKEDAIREGRRLVELWPLQRDAFLASDVRLNLAVIYMWGGERDAALQQLMEVAKVPVFRVHLSSIGLSAGELKLNPLWDELRSDPRFETIVAEAAKPIDLERSPNDSAQK